MAMAESPVIRSGAGPPPVGVTVILVIGTTVGIGGKNVIRVSIGGPIVGIATAPPVAEVAFVQVGVIGASKTGFVLLDVGETGGVTLVLEVVVLVDIGGITSFVTPGLSGWQPDISKMAVSPAKTK